MNNKFFVFAVLIVAGLTAAVARAHDPLASGINVWTRPTGLDMEIYMARVAATTLIEKPGETVAIFEDTFPQYKERLKAVGPELVIISADGATLKPERVEVGLTDENDVKYDIHFPLPAKGPLLLHVTYLPKMMEGHVASAYVMDKKGEDLGWSELTIEKPDLEARLPVFAAAAAASRPVETRAAAVEAMHDAPRPPEGGIKWVLGIGVVVAAVAAWMVMRGRTKDA